MIASSAPRALGKHLDSSLVVSAVATASNRNEPTPLRIDRSAESSASKRAMLASLLGLVLVASGPVLYLLLRDRPAPRTPVRVDTVRRVPLERTNAEWTAPGHLVSRQQAIIGSKAPGRVARVMVEVGQNVRAGDVLAELEHADLDALLLSKQAQLRQAQSLAAEAKKVAAQKERSFVHEQSIFDRKAGSQAALDAAEADSRIAAARAEALTASIEVARAQVQEAREAIANMTILAPFGGTIVTKDIEVGESIAPGGAGAVSGHSSVATLANLDQLEVETDVKEERLGQLATGDGVDVTVSAVPGREYQGRLREIARIADQARGVVKVKVAIVDPDEHLFPGLRAAVQFRRTESDRATDVDTRRLSVARSAVLSRDGREFVWRVDDERVVQTAVTTVGDSKEGLLSIDGDLAVGDRVVVDPPVELVNGAPVRIVD
jgi:RND family efflux transporter MFP subunit